MHVGPEVADAGGADTGVEDVDGAVLVVELCVDKGVRVKAPAIFADVAAICVE